MSKITLTNLVDLQNETTAVNAININNVALEAAFDNTLSRDGTSPNQMGSNLDMNSYRILNLPSPTSNYEPLRLIDVETLNGGGTISVSGLPAGGTSGQVLKKNSSTNYDTSWSTILTTIPTGGTSGQVLVKNSSSDYDASWAYQNATTVTPEQYGYTNYGAGDAGIAINSAIAAAGSNPLIIQFGPHNYNVITPIVISANATWLRGLGPSTTVTFAPAQNNQTLITYNAAPVTTGLYYGRITDFNITSADTANVKTAINLVDVGDMDISGIKVQTWSDTGTHTCVCLKTNGRQTCRFVNLKLFGDQPIQIKANPNSAALCADHFRFSDLYLLAYSANPCITVDSGVIFSNTVFDGFQAWVLGTYGFYWNGTTGASRSWNLSFNNIRSEGGSSAAAYTFYINPNAGVYGLNIKNCTPDPARKGIYLRNSFATISDCYFANTGAVEVLNADTTCASVRVDNLRVEASATQNVGGLTTKYSYNYTGAPAGVPANALYNI